MPCRSDASSGRGEGLADAWKPTICRTRVRSRARKERSCFRPCQADRRASPAAGSRRQPTHFRSRWRISGSRSRRPPRPGTWRLPTSCRRVPGSMSRSCRARTTAASPPRRRACAGKAWSRCRTSPRALDRRPGSARGLSPARHRRGRSRRGPGHRRRHRSAARRLRRHPVTARDRPVRGLHGIRVIGLAGHPSDSGS